MKKSIHILGCALLVVCSLQSCMIHARQYFNHTQLITSDSLRNIYAVQLTDRREIEFADCSGVYSPAREEVKGQTIEGEFIVIHAKDIVSCIAFK